MLANAALILDDHYFDPPLRLAVVLDEENFVWMHPATLTVTTDPQTSLFQLDGALFLPRDALEKSVGTQQVLRELSQLMGQSPLTTPLISSDSFSGDEEMTIKDSRLVCDSPMPLYLNPTHHHLSAISSPTTSSLHRCCNDRHSYSSFSPTDVSVQKGQGTTRQRRAKRKELPLDNIRTFPSGLCCAKGQAVSSICLAFSFGRCTGRSYGGPTTCVQAHVHPLVTAALRALAFSFFLKPPLPLNRQLFSSNDEEPSMSFHVSTSMQQSDHTTRISLRRNFCRTIQVDLSESFLTKLERQRHTPLLPSLETVSSNLVTPRGSPDVWTNPWSSPFSTQLSPTKTHPWKYASNSGAITTTITTTNPTRVNCSAKGEHLISSHLTPSPGQLSLLTERSSLSPNRDDITLVHSWNSSLCHASESFVDPQSLKTDLTQSSLTATLQFMSVRSPFVAPTMGWIALEESYRQWLHDGFAKSLLGNYSNQLQPKSFGNTQSHLFRDPWFCSSSSNDSEDFSNLVPYNPVTLEPEPTNHLTVNHLMKALISGDLQRIYHQINQLNVSMRKSPEPIAKACSKEQSDWASNWLRVVPATTVYTTQASFLETQNDLPIQNSLTQPSTRATDPCDELNDVRFRKCGELCPEFTLLLNCPLGESCPKLHIDQMGKTVRSRFKTELWTFLRLIKEAQVMSGTISPWVIENYISGH